MNKKYVTQEQKKEAKRLEKKRYYEKHKKEILQKSKLYREENKESIQKTKKEYRENNKERVRQSDKDYREKNKDRLKRYWKKWRKDNPDKVKYNRKKNYNTVNGVEQTRLWRLANPGKRAEQDRIRKSEDPIYKLSCSIRKKISKVFKEKGYGRYTKSEQIIGCTYKEFKEYIESNLEPWMNWDNYGKYNGEERFGWDIDHIVPLTIAKTEEDIIRINHYTNLRPLCSYINRVVKWKRLVTAE